MPKFRSKKDNSDRVVFALRQTLRSDLGFVFPKKLFSLLFFFTHFFAQAQNLKGFYLADSASKIPVKGAFIQNENASFNIVSDENGFVNLKNLPANSSKIVVYGIGYETQILESNQILSKIIYLKEKILLLSEIQIKAFSGNIFKAISELDIHLRPISNSQEVLRMVPGLFIGQHAGGGKAEQIFLRGFDLDHGTDINLTVDGMPANMVSHAHGQGYADLHFVIPELIEKVNFNKGTYFADKGNLTTAGFVEFRTKNHLDRHFFKAETGQFGTYRGIFGINLLKNKAEIKKQSLYLATENSLTQGYFESPQDFSRFNGTLKYHRNLNESQILTATLTGFTSQWNASGQIPERAVNSGLIGFYGAIDDKEGGKTSRYNANLELQSNLKNGGILKNQLFYSNYHFELYSNFTFFREDSINGDQIRQKEKRNILGYNGSYQKDFSLGKLKTQSFIGVQIRKDDISDIELTRTKNRSINTNAIMLGNVQELNVGAYWSQRFFISSKLELTAALRGDYFSNKYNNQLNDSLQTSESFIFCPKLKLDYWVNDQIQLYLHNGKGFHSNDTRVAVQQNGKKVLPPAYGTDLGGIFKIGNKLFLQTALWYLWLDQEFVYVGDEGVVEAGGQTQRYGFDLSARYEILENLFADLDLSFANPRAINVSKEDSYLPLAPRFTSVGGLTYRKTYGWNGSLRYRYMGDRPANEDNSVTAKGYFVADATVKYSQKNWELGLNIQNFLNTKWKETQFDTKSRLQNEPNAVSEIHFTAGTPFWARVNFTRFF